MISKAKGVRMSLKEIELVARACEKVGATFSDFVRAAAVTAALFVLGEIKGASSKELVKRLAQEDLAFFGFAGVKFKDGKVYMLFHAPVELADLTIKHLKEVKEDEQEARAEAAG